MNFLNTGDRGMSIANSIYEHDKVLNFKFKQKNDFTKLYTKVLRTFDKKVNGCLVWKLDITLRVDSETVQKTTMLSPMLNPMLSPMSKRSDCNV